MSFVRGPGKVFARPLDPREGNEWDFIGFATSVNYAREPGAPLLTVLIYRDHELICVREYRRSYRRSMPARMWKG